MSRVGRHPVRRGAAAALCVLVAVAGLAAAEAGGPDVAAAAAKFRQPTCAKEKAKVRKTTGQKRRAATAKHKQCMANLAVYQEVADSHLVGSRTDGVTIDTIYCANGKWQDDVGRGGAVGTQGWRVVDARMARDGRGFTATVEAKIPGGRHVQAVVKDGDRWQVGYEWNGEAHNAGDVERSDASSACATL
ncbi:MAG: hypothetical protein R2736_23165 [Solirubrobacterales bacterium]